MTRTETDIYTITDRDTTTAIIQKNTPGQRDNGIIYPSSREIRSDRNLVQHDSIVTREYPDFIRLGVFESVGLIGTSSDKGLGVGMFAIFPGFGNLRSDYRGGKDYVFTGGFWRLGIGEWRLRWFRDAANWTIGTDVFEVLAPEGRIERTLMAAFPIYIRKRYFLREKIPYISFTPSVGIGYYPSQYLNMAASLDVGSIGGLNVRAYAGLAAGMNTKSSPQVAASEVNNRESQSVVFPYFGLGISFLDFLNLVKETRSEWKYYEHSSWNIGLMDYSMIITGADSSAFSAGNEKAVFSGFILRLLNASIALPALDYKLYAGTSLANFIMLGQGEYGLGILPFRIGLWQPVIEDDLTTEPFIEFSYYPSKVFHIGNRLNLKISDLINLSLVLGYINGKTANETFIPDFTSDYGKEGSFSRPYIGINIGMSSRIFFPSELRYNK
ncbi:MAG TPA: hypothetical protein VHP30_04740 [Ignavibacteriales bacterium]|nr:hypothetical protein [Ignavibacteriales bacterium]